MFPPANSRTAPSGASSNVERSGRRVVSSDDYAVKDKVHLHDLHATMLHLLGFDHTKLTYRYAGRDFRLTDVHGEVVSGLLA